MSVGMATRRIRLIIDTSAARRRAVRIRAAVTGDSPSEVLNALIDECLDHELKQAARAIRDAGGDPDAMEEEVEED